ncbi:hypothetical protein [Clostridium perfringens]|uniref:hypothetical protein n=1 Tax=Clostridium perfringens TaxID=1502 RepID=UPI002245F9C3|nr:hypothetical protein [Clostridium perfringens]MCX0412832.1 hypothetical protein [Clostridium perfringens]
MFKVSEVFNKEINKLQGRKFNAKVIIRDKEYSGNQIYEMNLEESVNPSDSFSIGSICSNSFDIKLINTGDIFDNAIVKPYVGLYIGDDIEYIPLGVFTVIKTSVKGKFINLECVDNMLGLEKVYFSDLSYPADINDIAKEICKKAGVNLASKLPNYRVNKIEGYSLREAIGFIASLCGSFARFNRIGDLEVRDYEVVKQEMTPHNLFKLDIEANECIIKKVIAKKGEEELSTGTDDGNKIVFNNPIITKEILSDIYTKYNGFKYIPYTAKWKGNPAIMAGDILNLTDLNGNKYNALIMEQKFTYKNGISSEVKAKGKTRQDSSFDSKGSVAQSMERYSIEQANIKKALIDKASINDLTAVDAKIQRLYTEDLTAIRADIVTLNSQKANIIELNSVRADLQQAIIGKANITDLNAAVGKINILESKTASIENALNKNLTAENIATGAITAGSGIIAEGAIGDAEISSLSVNKLKVGDITTSKHRIVSADGTIEIVGNQILINRNNVNRVILGEYRKTDGTTDYGLLIRGKDGKTIMLDSDGVHNAGITNGAIDNNKVADNANISGNKLDINSVIREVNNNGTETIKGTKVTVGDRTLDVELSTQNNTITEHSKELSSQKASLTALDNALKFKVDSQTFTQSTTTINNNINRAKEEAINTANSNTTNAINSLEIGGRNLVLDSLVNESSSNYEFAVREVKGLEPNTEYIFSANGFIKSNNEKKSLVVYIYPPDWSWSYNFNLPYDNAETRFIKFRTPNEIKKGIVVRACCAPNSQAVDKNLATLNWYKVEKGNKLPTDWTPAPEDLKAYSDDVAKAKADLAQANAIANADGKITEEERKRIAEARKNLDTAIVKATEAETKAKSYADSKKQEAIKAAENLALEKSNLAKKYADEVATAKSNLAQANAIANADGKITEEERKRIQQAQENLNTAISKADKAKQDAINEANRVAELKKQEAINSANSHADSKANEALNNAKAFVNAEITTVNSHLNKATSEINILKEKIESKVSKSDVDKSITDIQIGGRNLIKNLMAGGNTTSNNGVVKLGKTNTDTYFNIDLYEALIIGEVYTISLDANNVGSGVDWQFGIQSQNNKYKIHINKNGRIYATFVAIKTENMSKILIDDIGGRLGNNDIVLSKFKVEKGNKATDYTEAPEQLNQNIIDNIKIVTDKITTVESKLTQENNSIKASVQDLNSTTQSITTNVSNINRDLTSKINSNLDAAKSFATDIATNKANTAKQEAISSANSHSDSIAASKANEALNNSKAYTNAQINTVNTKVHNVESNLSILSDKISTKVSQSDIDKTVENVKFANRNYLKKSLLNTTNSDYCIARLYFGDEKPQEGDEFTVSIKGELGEGKHSFGVYNSGGTVSLISLDNKNSDGIYKGTFKWRIGTSSNTYLSIYTIYSSVVVNSTIEWVKLEKGNKVSNDWTPAPEDTNQLVVDSIKVVDTKISDVSSSVTQLRDSVTTQINSINSKTHSIETNLGGKASKQEVTEVNNRVATIKASLDSITQRVSSTESKAQTLESNINDKASKQEVVNINGRVTNVETNLNGITNRVSATESRINTLDGRIASAVTIQQFTEYKQSNRDFQLRVAQTTNLHNLVPNGTFAGGLREWICGGEFWSGPYTGYGFSGKVCGAVKNKSTSEKFLTSYKSFKVEKNTTYTLNFHYKVEQNIQSMEAFVMLSNTESGDYGQVIRVMQALGGERSDLTNDIPYSFTFNTGNFEWVWLRFDNNGMKPNTNLDEYCWLYISEVAVYKGNVGAVKYLPKGGETYDTTFKLDGMGYNCKFASGAWNQIGEEGNMWYAPGMKYPYRSLSYHEAVSINTDGSNNYIYRDVQLPARFDYVDPQYIDITASLKGWYKYTGKPFSSENITVSTGRVYRANGHTYAQVACRGCIRDNDTFTTEGLQVVATLHVTA